MLEKIKNNQNKFFLGIMAIFMCLMAYRFFLMELSSFNVTLYAFGYKYGFMSRGLIGTLWQGIDFILPGDQMTYQSLFTFNIVITVIYLVVMFILFCVIVKRTEKENMRNMRYLIIFLSIFAIPIFMTRANFGRIDLFLYIITFVCLICIVKEKMEWICIPLVTIAECIHQGFVFMNINIILVLFFVKALKKEGKKRKKYIALLVITFIVASIMFLYFEFFSRINDVTVYNEIVSTAKSLSASGQAYGKMLVQHEILGMDVWMEEWSFHLDNFIDVPIFLLFFLPYLIIGIHFLKNLVKSQNTTKDKITYLAVAVGSLTVLPEMILKVDFARYVFAIFFYYIAITMCLIALKDKCVANQLEQTKGAVKKTIPFAIVLLIYPIMFMPLYDIVISLVDSNLCQIITNGDFYVSK